uniref:Putative secreted protein n=1 Tax=Ixodes ricinus TaxID=34613 RepID=A0A6B0U6E4_IXORI
MRFFSTAVLVVGSARNVADALCEEHLGSRRWKATGGANKSSPSVCFVFAFLGGLLGRFACRVGLGNRAEEGRWFEYLETNCD